MKEKNAARFHGRRGGRFIHDNDHPGERLDGFRDMRVAAVARGNWPPHSLDMWRARAAANPADHVAAAVVEADDHARAVKAGRYADKTKKENAA